MLVFFCNKTYHRVQDSGCEFHLIEARIPNHEYEVTHRGDQFFVLTNWDADNFRLMQTPLLTPGRQHWTDVQAHDPEVLIEGILMFRDYYILAERFEGLPRLKIKVEKQNGSFFIQMQEESYDISAASGRDFAATNFRYWVSTPRLPSSLYEFDALSRQATLLKKRIIPDPHFDENNYVVRRLWASARDGARIPLTALHHKNFGLDKPRPVLLHAYGSYGEIVDADFSSYRFCLVDRGFVYVLAHIRGGMEMGRNWYLDGKLDKKWNSFNDFIDATESLIAQRVTRPGWVVGEGSSAGGMLMGVVANERPELYLGIVASVPFVDVLNTMLDEELPLTALEYHEWGNPRHPKDYDLIKSYSPYDNVRQQHYPHMLITAGLHDQRVMYWEAAKWVAKLRGSRKDKNTLLFRTELSAGHGGASGRYDALKELSEELCFIVILLDRLTSATASQES